ncbi:1823_t:CDS:2, partial [Paraglomus occultum]
EIQRLGKRKLDETDFENSPVWRFIRVTGPLGSQKVEITAEYNSGLGSATYGQNGHTPAYTPDKERSNVITGVNISPDEATAVVSFQKTVNTILGLVARHMARMAIHPRKKICKHLMDEFSNTQDVLSHIVWILQAQAQRLRSVITGVDISPDEAKLWFEILGEDKY